MKDVRSQGGGGSSSTDIFLTRGYGGSSDMDVRTFLVQKTSNFSKFMVCPHRRRLSQCGHFTDKRGGGQGRPLWKAP